MPRRPDLPPYDPSELVRRHLGRDPQAILRDYFDFVHSSIEDHELASIRDHIVEVMSDPARYIDKGGAASVYSFASIVRKLCAKFLYEREHAPDPGHPPMVEASFMMRLEKFRVNGVRSPVCYVVNEGGPDSDLKKPFILMERLNAINLQHVLNDPKLAPASFDPQDFLDRLGDYLQELHGQMGILHGDLAPRNVMVDLDTGHPYVIDFGRSQYLSRISDEGIRRALTEQELDVFNSMCDDVYSLDNS